MHDDFISPYQRPGNAALAYSSVIRQTEDPRSIERRVFSRVTAALEATRDAEADFNDRIQAAHNNRELWQTLAFDLASDGNAMPDDLRARLLSLAIWVTRETQRALTQKASFQDLIEVNRSIMAGLQQSALGAT